MSKIARTLILAATVAALNLASMTAIAHAQANDQDTTSQQQLAENWNYYQQATRVPPAELQARMQAKGRGDTSTATPTQVPAPVQPTEPSGQPAWLVVSLGGLAAVLALVAGLALMAARRANRRARVEQTA